VLVIGAAKCGTTSISDLLTDTLELYDKTYYFHGKLESGRVKEPELFCDPYFTNHNFKLYVTNFRDHSKPSFDGSVCYFSGGAEVAERMYKLYHPSDLKKKKFILALRNPISMLLSSYHHIYGDCKERISTERCNPDVKEGEPYHDTFRDFLIRSEYLTEPIEVIVALKQWLEYIPRRQIFIINFESLSGITYFRILVVSYKYHVLCIHNVM
jgi:hypothetical protein